MFVIRGECMEKWKKRAIDLMSSIAFGGRSDPTVVPYYPQKIMINMPEKKFFPRSVPEKQGISSKRIYNMLCELESEKHANIHTIMVLRHGQVISECSSDGYDTNTWHISHSMAKTVCGMVIGTLFDEGKLNLNDKLVDIFPEIDYRDKKFSQITIEHLLSMSSGVDFAEAGAVTDSQWTTTFFSANVRFTPGTKFAYNSMNTYILARVAERISGRSFGQLVRERVFLPLDIQNYFWEKGPEGTEKGGWGLYLSAESWAKLGALMASGGSFFGKRILSAEWVKKATTTKAIAPESSGNFNYGYQLWTARRGEDFLFNGMLGQNVWICPKNDIIVVMLAGNNELFQASPALEIVRKHLGGRLSDRLNRRDIGILKDKEKSFFECRRWLRPKEKGRGLLCWLGIRPGDSFDDRWNALLGRYKLCNNNIGMMPLIVRTMQNNFCSSIEEISLRREGERLYLDYFECGEAFSIRVGLYGYESNILCLRGEPYIVLALGEAKICSESEIEYRILLIPSETASVRRISIKKKKDRITVEFGESPNNRVVEGLISHYSELNGTLAFAMDVIERRMGDGFVTEMLRKTFNPRVVGADTSVEGYEKIINEENERLVDEAKKLRVIRGLIDRFRKDEEREENAKAPTSIEEIMKKSISNFMDRISGKCRQNE